MKLKNSKLVIRQLDNKMIFFAPLRKAMLPTDGWVKTIRTTINMSLKQLGSRMSMTPQSIRDLERREIAGTVTLNTLQDAANALNMKLVYGFVPVADSLEKLVERRAHELAYKIVKRTSGNMKLEDQENSDERIAEAINELADEIKREMPKTLWDQ